MKVKINGKEHKIENGSTVLAMLLTLGLKPELTIVELNADIIDRSRYGETELREGDTLELVRIVGGG